jgi:hypothetical protein
MILSPFIYEDIKNWISFIGNKQGVRIIIAANETMFGKDISVTITDKKKLYALRDYLNAVLQEMD